MCFGRIRLAGISKADAHALVAVSVEPAGMLIAVELAVVFWLVYGGLASIGMPGLFWNPDAWTMMRLVARRHSLRLLDALLGIRA